MHLVEEIEEVTVSQALGTWTVMLRRRDGSLRPLVPAIGSEAHASAIALWVRVGISRARGAQAPATQPPTINSP